jgi:hypothetical protein
MSIFGERPSRDVRRRELALASLGLVTMTVDSLGSLALLRLGLPHDSQEWAGRSLLLLSALVLPIATLGFAIWGWRSKGVRPVSAVLSIVVALCGLSVIVVVGLVWLLFAVLGPRA